MDVEQTTDAQHQREPTDDLEPLGDGGQHLLRSGMRHVVLRRKHDAGDESDQERNLSSE